jgi:hypothetical protein
MAHGSGTMCGIWPWPCGSVLLAGVAWLACLVAGAEGVERELFNDDVDQSNCIDERRGSQAHHRESQEPPHSLKSSERFSCGAY